METAAGGRFEISGANLNGRITTILYLLAKQNPVPYKFRAGRHLREMMLFCFVATMHATRVALKHKALQPMATEIAKFLKIDEKHFKAARCRCDRFLHPTGLCVTISLADIYFLRGRQVKAQLLIDGGLNYNM